MSDLEKRPLVIKRIVKGDGGHHGGAWKVAYADFVTAMMAFFLLMWLMGTTTKEQKAAVSDYFNNPSSEMGASPTPKPNGGEGPGGASTSPIDLGGGLDQPTPPPPEATPSAATEEQQRLQGLADTLQQALENDATLAPFKERLLIELTSEGLRLQILDQEHHPMFAVGSARLLPGNERILHAITQVITQVPNRISITGHTDARLYANTHYSNWELSSERANAARRELIRQGLAEEKIAGVVGLASSVPFDPKDTLAPINRRISIMVLKQQVDEAAQARERPGTALGQAATPVVP